MSLASRTSSRTRFEVLSLGLQGQVLGLGLEAWSPLKLPCPLLENSTVFWILRILLENARNLAENLRRPFLFFSFGDCLKKILKTFFWDRLKILNTFFFAPVSLVLDLSCPWPREGLSLVGLSLASDFFCVLGLEPSVLDSTSGYHVNEQRWSRGHKARGQGQGQGHKKNPRPRPRPRTAFPRTDTLEAKDRNAWGRGQGPRTQSASALQKKKKIFTEIFQAISKKKKKKKKKKGLHKKFSSDLR